MQFFYLSAIQLCAVNVHAQECCGDVEFDPGKTSASQAWDVGSVKSLIEAAIAAIPYVGHADATANASIKFTQCCDGSDTVVSSGVGTVSGQASLSATVDKTISLFSFYFTFHAFGCEVGAIVDVGSLR
jgi:hypothetical protein